MHEDNNTRVLVMMSSYNGEAFIAQQIDSILNQTHQDIDIVVRDDGSSDSTLAILAKYERENGNFSVLAEENRGCTGSFWELLQYARQKKGFYAYFAFCDQDDVWLEDKIAVAIGCLAKTDSSLPCLYCSNLILTDARLNRNSPTRNGGDDGWKQPSAHTSSIIPTNGTIGCTIGARITTRSISCWTGGENQLPSRSKAAIARRTKGSPFSATDSTRIKPSSLVAVAFP